MSEFTQKQIDPNYDINKTPFEWDKLASLCAFKSSLPMCAELIGVHGNTIKQHIAKRFGLTFGEYQERKLSPTKYKLIQKALDLAIKKENVTMLIFCLKNICKWVDRVDEEMDTAINVFVKSHTSKQ